MAAGQLRAKDAAPRETPAAICWRRSLRRHLALLLALKFAALALLWALCFSSVHRTPVASTDAAGRLALREPPSAHTLPAGAPRPGESR